MPNPYSILLVDFDNDILALDVTPDCVHIHVPVLIISGNQDGATAETIQPLYTSILDAKWIVMQGGPHMVHLQDPSQYINHIADFLD